MTTASQSFRYFSFFIVSFLTCLWEKCKIFLMSKQVVYTQS